MLQYVREPTPSSSGAALPPASDAAGRLHFVRIFIDEKIDLSELLVKEGHAKTQPHRVEDDRADNYDVLLELEREASAARRGIHKPEGTAGVSAGRRQVDLLGPGNSQRTKAFLSQLSKPARIDAVVEHVFNSGRFKLTLPAHNLAISFALGGLRTPATARPPGVGGPKGRRAEPFADEAAVYARDNLMQRDVQIHIDNCDRGGNFIGSLYLKDKTNFAVKLLEMGFAYTVEFSLAQSSHKDEYLAAEAKAKTAKTRIWGIPGFIDSENDTLAADRDVDETLKATISHIHSVQEFFIQEEHCQNLVKVVTFTSAYTGDNPSEEYTPGGPPRKGEFVLGKFTADDQWYRGRVEGGGRGSEDLRVTYIDFGNNETLPLSRIRRLPQDVHVKAIPAAAKMCALSGVVGVNGFEDEAAAALHRLTEGLVFTVKVERIQGGKLRKVVLIDEESAQTPTMANALSVNEQLLKQGMVRVDKKSITKMFSRFQKAEEIARKAHLVVWRYGDIGDDDEFDNDFPSMTTKQSQKSNK